MTEKNKQKLIDKVLERIKEDVADGDLTAIDELLKSCPDKELKSFLSEFEYINGSFKLKKSCHT